MISPLGQRQILQTAAVETVRLAMDGSFQVQREQARRQAFDAKLAEAQKEVPDVGESDGLKLGNQAPRDQGSRQHGTGASEESPETNPDGTPAGPAEPHLDFLA